MGTIEYLKAKNQEISLKVNDYWIHSRYNPSLEAEKFIKQVILPTYEDGKILFIVGSALGYLEQILQQSYQYIHFVSYDFIEYDTKYALYHDKKMLPTNTALLQKILYTLIDDANCAMYQLVVWQAITNIYETSVRMVSNHFTQMQSSAQTLAHFGWRWLRNGVKNFLRWEEQLILPKINSICLTGSGAGLLDAIPYLQKMREHYFIFAVSSSVYTLRSHGIEPDLVISIDGGFYAKQHLQHAKNLPVITALLGATTINNDTSVLSLGSFFENWVEKHIATLPKGRWAGTVTATAIDLALSMASEEVILIGQDFELRNGYTHAKPHAFFDDFRNIHERLKPMMTHYHSLESHSLATLPQYRNWFTAQQWSKKLKRFSYSSYDLGIETVTPEAFCKQYRKEKFTISYESVPNLAIRREYLMNLLNEWQRNPLQIDLVTFLFTSEKTELLLAQNREDHKKVIILKNDLEAKVQDRLATLKEYLD